VIRDTANSRVRDAIVLVRGFVAGAAGARQRASGTVTLITGDPLVIVDTGAPEQRREILDALAAHRVNPAAIRWVVNTHGHLDHVGNNNLFPNATFVLDSDLANDGEYWIHDFRQRSLEIESRDGGDPIVVMLTPGHTDHDLSVVVKTSAGTIAVVGDLFEYEGDWNDNAWRAWSKDPVAQQASRGAVLALADYIIPGHGDRFRVER
jgi:glyoxylase-like metal-dependent hydrolase (beta-lactamase superfamily II)